MLPVDGLARASGPNHDGRRTTDLRGILPLADQGHAGALRSLAAHHDHRPAAADAAAVVGGRASHSSRFGAELRASVPRFVDHVTAISAISLQRRFSTRLALGPGCQFAEKDRNEW